MAASVASRKLIDRRSLAVAAILTGVAGLVDAVGFLTYSHIYTANMSGNTVSFGIGIGTVNLSEVLVRGWPVLVYTFGLIFGRILLEVAARSNFSRDSW